MAMMLGLHGSRRPLCGLLTMRVFYGVILALHPEEPRSGVSQRMAKPFARDGLR